MNFVRVCSSLFKFAGSRNIVPAMTSKPSLVANARQFCTGHVIFEVESVEDFAEKVINSPVPVVVDFHADWCGPCRVLGPRLEEKVMGRGGEVVMAKVNVDYAGELAMDYQVSAVPTVISFKNGEKVASFQGVIEDQDIDDFIDDAINH